MRPETKETWCKSEKSEKSSFFDKNEYAGFIELSLEKLQQQKNTFARDIVLWCKMEGK